MSTPVPTANATSNITVCLRYLKKAADVQPESYLPRLLNGRRREARHQSAVQPTEAISDSLGVHRSLPVSRRVVGVGGGLLLRYDTEFEKSFGATQMFLCKFQIASLTVTSKSYW